MHTYSTLYVYRREKITAKIPFRCTVPHTQSVGLSATTSLTPFCLTDRTGPYAHALKDMCSGAAREVVALSLQRRTGGGTVLHFRAERRTTRTPHYHGIMHKEPFFASVSGTPTEVPPHDVRHGSGNMDAILGNTHRFTVTLSDADRRRHIYISGKTGTGKSTFLQSLMAQDLKAGRPFALLDPHGDLSISIANACHHHAIYLNPSDPTHAVGFNPLHKVPISERSKVAAHIVASFRHLWRDSWGPRLEYILTNCVRLLLDTDHTLLAIPLLLTNSTFREHVLQKSTDPFITSFWLDEYNKLNDRVRTEAIAPIQNKVGMFTHNSTLRTIIGQTSTIDIADIMERRTYLIANLSKTMGEQPAHLLGAFLATAFAQAAEERATIPEEQRHDFTLYVDEFQNFATDSFASILSEARKWRLNLVLANQFLTQIPEGLRAALLGNVGTLVVFRVGADDADILAREIRHTNPPNLVDTPNFKAWVRTGTAEPELMQTIPADLPTGQLDRVIRITHARHARPRSLVEARIRAFIEGASTINIRGK